MTPFKEYAQFYDLYYADKNYEAETRFVLELAKRFAVSPHSVLDMGCGTGRHLQEFLNLGLHCEGFDQSSEMLDHARKRLSGTDVRLSKADLTTFPGEKTYDLVVSLFAVMGYLVSNEDLIAGLQTARKHLNPGGVFVFDGWFGPAVLDQHPERRRHQYRQDGNTIVRAATPTLDVARQTVAVEYDLEISNNGQKVQHFHEQHSMRLMFLQEVALAAHAAGLEIVHCCPFMEADGQLTSKTWNVCFVARDISAKELVRQSSENRSRTKEIEWVKNENQVLALILPVNYQPTKSEFMTPDTYKQQVGYIVYPEGGVIVPHLHHELERNLNGTSEVLLVRNGRCCVDFYLDDKSFFCTRELTAGDVLVLVSGGHGFRMIEDTVFLEVKQGPYIGEHEKERFSAYPHAEVPLNGRSRATSS